MRQILPSVFLMLVSIPGPCRADDRAEALVSNVLHRVKEERPALALYEIDCAWNKQPTLKWTIDGCSNHSSLRWFDVTEQYSPQQDLLFPTGLFVSLRRHIDPFPDEFTVLPKEARMLPPEDLQGIHCEVIEFSGALPAGGGRLDGTPARVNQSTVLRDWDSAALRWYVDQEHRIRRITAWFQWKEWAGDTDVRLTMDALIPHRKPKTGAPRPLSPPPLQQFRTGANPAYASMLAYSPNGRWLAALGADGATVYDTRDWKAAAKLRETRVSSLCFSPDSGTMATTTGNDGLVMFWDAATGAQKPQIATALKYARSCAFLPGNRLLIGGSDDGSVLWDLTLGKPSGAPGVASATLIAASTDGHWVAAEQKFATILHDMTGKQPDRTLVSPNPRRSGIWAPRAAAFSPDGKWVAIGDNRVNNHRPRDPGVPADGDPWVRVFDVSTGSLVSTLMGSNGTILSLAFSPDGRMLAVGDEDNIGETDGNNGGVVLWDTVTWKPLGVMAVDGEPAVRQIAFSPDGKLLATAGYSPFVKIWTVPSLTPRH